MKFEYQTLEMPMSFGISMPHLPDIGKVLNEHGRDRWQLKQLVLPSGSAGGTDRVLLILERSLA